LSHSIQDDQDNFTRFFLIWRGADCAPDAPLQTRKRRACVALMLSNRPGALRDALTPFAEHRLNMRSIVSRPSRMQPFAYRFYCEIQEAEHDTLMEALSRIDGIRGCSVSTEGSGPPRRKRLPTSFSWRRPAFSLSPP
jgi:prephenate dehydratase